MDELRDEITSHTAENRDELLEIVSALVEQRSDNGHEKRTQNVVIDELEDLDIEPDIWEPDVMHYKAIPSISILRPIKSTNTTTVRM